MNDMTGYVEQLAEAATAELELITSGKKPYLEPQEWHPGAYAATAPESGVTLDGGPLLTCFERNIDYLNEWFEKTRSWQIHADEDNWWERDLPASSEGRMLGAAAHTLRWGEREDMRRIVDTVVAGVKVRQRDDGYCLPYDESAMEGSEKPGLDERRNYDRVNLTRGMVAAANAGNSDALPTMRRFYDWLYASPYCAGLLGGPYDATSPKSNDIAGKPGMGTAHNCNNGHEGSLLMYFSPAGKPEDLLAVERYFVQDFFIDACRKREALSLSDYPFHVAHSYVFLAFKAWLDHYRATGAEKYIEGARGAWDIVHDHFLHIGGSAAICEAKAGIYPPDSLYIHTDKEHHTGENCGSVFWADINHRFLQFFPEEAKYADQIEAEVFNCILANQDGKGHIRYHARLEGEKQEPHSINTCCEVMGTPFIASLPQYIYSIAEDGLYVNLFAPSTIEWGGMTLTQETAFPFEGDVTCRVSGVGRAASGEHRKIPMTLRVRVPGWATCDVEVRVNGQAAAEGMPGSYVEFDRTWENGDEVSFTLPLGLRAVRYIGLDQHPEHARNALLRGPVLMALVGADDLDVPASELPDRLRPIDGKLLHFAVEGRVGVHFMPYWQLNEETFTCFPTMR